MYNSRNYVIFPFVRVPDFLGVHELGQAFLEFEIPIVVRVRSYLDVHERLVPPTIMNELS